jgi:hypothetical protein
MESSTQVRLASPSIADRVAVPTMVYHERNSIPLKPAPTPQRKGTVE